MNASVAIQVLPNVTEDEEVIRIVDEVIAYIKSFGLSTSVGPFETTIEGDYDQLMEIVAGCQKIAIKAGFSVSRYPSKCWPILTGPPPTGVPVKRRSPIFRVTKRLT